MNTPELDYITVKGFKSIAVVEKLELRPINVVLGSNGSGKSNLIGVFAFLHALREGKIQDYVAISGGADKILHFGSRVTAELTILVSFKNETNQYEVTLKPTDTDTLFPSKEYVYYWDKAKYPSGPLKRTLDRVGNEAGISAEHKDKVADWVRYRLAKWRLYHFHDTSAASPMKKTGDLNDNQFLRPDGTNLAAFLYLLKTKKPNAYSLIRATLQRVMPFFDDFELTPSKLNPDKIRLEWRHKNSDKYFDASSFSDGSLRFIALTILFLQPEEYRPSVILVDEPELGLHPYAITMLASLIKIASEQTQVIVSTQSPLLLDHFTPEDVMVAERVASSTRFRRLDSQQLGSWLSEYSLGQLWEKNEFGGRPSVE